MIWGEKGKNATVVEPFFASLRVSKSGEELFAGYRIMCGDAARELGKSPYATLAATAEQSNPEDWIFVFSDGTI